MGGRGSSSGVSDNGKLYGTEYTTLWKGGNIKFVKINSGAPTAPLETQTKGRVYVTLNAENRPKYISYYDTALKRIKQIDLDRPHKGISPHTHHGYAHNEKDSAKGFANLTPKEKRMVELVKKTWYDKYGKS